MLLLTFQKIRHGGDDLSMCQFFEAQKIMASKTALYNMTNYFYLDVHISYINGRTCMYVRNVGSFYLSDVASNCYIILLWHSIC